MSEQPRVSANDWRVLNPPTLGAWEPTLSVTVVIPTYDAAALPWVLAGLAAQSYPEHLLEVVVVDDSENGTLELPELRPARTRVVANRHGWGPAGARQSGADVAEGDVVHWLDADMVVEHREVEAQLRWHHLIDYAVVLGHKSFADADALAGIDPRALKKLIADGASVDDLAGQAVEPHTWIEEILAETASLADAGPRAMRVHAGASASVARSLLRDSGEMPLDVTRGEDIVLGYRLREAGAVFIPDPQAHSLHLGASAVMRGAHAINRYANAFLMQHVPEFRGHRAQVHRSYAVPYVEVVAHIDGASYEEVRALVDSQLVGSVPDLVVTLVADWTSLNDGRRATLADPHVELRMIRAAYAAEPRVRLSTALADRSDATFRVILPDVTAFPVERSLAKLLRRMELDHLGCVDVDMPVAGTARVLRTAAHARALRTTTSRSGYEQALTDVYPRERVTAADVGFACAEDAPAINKIRGLVRWGVRETKR